MPSNSDTSVDVGLDESDFWSVASGLLNALFREIKIFEADVAAGRVRPVHRDGKERILQLERMQRSYFAFRDLFVNRVDPNSLGYFRALFYGSKGDPRAKEVVLRYAKLRSVWHKKTPAYREYHKKYMRDYMARKRAAAKAAKLAEVRP
jgi:hypothetical protein